MKILKSLFLALTILCFGCSTPDSDRQVSADSTIKRNQYNKEPTDSVIHKSYSNDRFKDVAVTRIAEDSISISGKAQVFEAVFNWTLKDGDKDIKSGYQMTNAGAPGWGNFKFGVTLPRQKSNSPLRLVLFEASAKDGSETFELTIPFN